MATSRKGKQKAREDDLEQAKAGMEFCIRFTSAEEGDLVALWVGEHETVRTVKHKIRTARSATLLVDGQPRRLRLIYLGRLLTDGTLLVPWIRSILARQRESLARDTEQAGKELGVLLERGQERGERLIEGLVDRVQGRDSTDREKARAKGKEKEKLLSLEEGLAHEEEKDERIWLHCSVGDVEDAAEGEAEKEQTTQLQPLRGFDRLREAGFSDEDIEGIRAQFRESNDGPVAPAGVAGDEDEHARALEDQWMEGLTSSGADPGASDMGAGVFTTLLQGVCVGFFLPFLPLFFFRSQIFSRRMQMAIALGMTVNICFGLLRAFN